VELEGVGGPEEVDCEDGDLGEASANMKSMSLGMRISSLVLETRLFSIEIGVETSDVSELEFEGDEARLE